MQHLIRSLLEELGEDPSREGLVRTPTRVEKALKFLTSGYEADIDTVLNDALFSVDYNEMVIVRDIDFYSLCEHHLLPFFGKCHVAYIPNGRVIGLSKIPRLVDIFARRLQLQERMTNQIAETIREKINPLGVAVVCEGTHLCMAMRGVEKQNSYTVTSAMLGVFRDHARTRMEFLELLKLRERRLVQVGGLQQFFAREPDVARVFAERLGPGQALGGDEGARNPRTSSRLLSGLETAVDRLKVVFDDAQRQIVIALGGEHVTQPLNVGVGELAIAGRRSLWLDQSFSFKEADLRDRDVGKVGPQLG